MATGEKLVPISLEDLPSLIRTIERLGGVTNTDAVNNLKSYKRYLEDAGGPKFIQLKVYTLDNDWEVDGLFLFQVILQYSIPRE